MIIARADHVSKGKGWGQLVPEKSRLDISSLKGGRSDDESSEIEREEDTQRLADSRPGCRTQINQKPNAEMVGQEIFLIPVEERQILQYDIHKKER